LEKSIPSEVIRGGTASLLGYLRTLKGTDTALNRCKLLFVGRAGAGKTTLLRRLQGDTFVSKPDPTAGIDMSEWTFTPEGEKKITFTAWDFAGQRVYYSTHQLFLTARTVYLLCWSLRDAEERDFGLSFWLHSIQAKAPGSRVIIVGTRCAEYPAKTRVPENLSAHLEEKFTTLHISFVAVDSSEDDGNIPSLKARIYEAAMETNGVTARFPDIWISLLKCVQRMRGTRKIFPLPDFKQHLSELATVPAGSISTPAPVSSVSVSTTIPIAFVLDDAAMAEKALQYATDDEKGFFIAVQVLHEMGVLFLSKAGNFVITDPVWLADIFKRVLSWGTGEKTANGEGGHTQGVYSVDGSITSQELKKCWKGLKLCTVKDLELADRDLNMLLTLLFEAELAFPKDEKDWAALKSIRYEGTSDSSPFVDITYLVPAISPLEPQPDLSNINEDPFKAIKKFFNGSEDSPGIHRRFVLNFVPGGLLHRLTFKSSFRAIAVTKIWQRGVILKYDFDGENVDVLMELGDSSLHLAIVTNLQFPVEFYVPFLQALEALLASEFSGSEWHVEASCPCSKCRGLDYDLRYYVPVETLRCLWESHQPIVCIIDKTVPASNRLFEKMSPPKFAPELIFGNLLPLQHKDHAKRGIKLLEMASAFFAFRSDDIFLGEAELVLLANGKTWVLREMREKSGGLAVERNSGSVPAAPLLADSGAAGGQRGTPAVHSLPSDSTVGKDQSGDVRTRELKEMEEMIKRLFRSEVCSPLEGVRREVEGVKIGMQGMAKDINAAIQGIAKEIKVGFQEMNTLLPTLFIALIALRDDSTPSLFLLIPQERKSLLKKLDLFNNPYELQFLCEHHEGTHAVTEKHDHDVKFYHLKLLEKKLRRRCAGYSHTSRF